MNKKTFLQNLESDIRVFSPAEKERIRNYYSEILEDRMEEGMTEEEAVSSLGSPEAITEQILADYKLHKDPLEPKKSRKRRKLTLAFTSPFWIMGWGVYFALLACIYAVTAMLAATLAALFAVCALAPIAYLISLPFVFSASFLHGMLNLGAVFLFAGLFFFLLMGMKKSLKGMLSWAKWLTLKTRNLLFSFFGVSREETQQQSDSVKAPASPHTASPRKIWIPAAGFLVIGLLITLSQFIAIDFDIEKLSTAFPLTDMVYECTSDNISNIVIDTAYFDVATAKSTDGKIRIFYQANNPEACSIEEAGGSLKMKQRSKQNWVEYLFVFSFDTREGKKDLRLELPEQYDGTLKIKDSNANVTAEDIPGLRNLEIQNSYGTVTLNNLAITEGLSIRNPNGDISLSNIETEGGITAGTSYSEITAEKLRAGSISMKADSSNILLDSLDAASDINIQTSYGKIRLTNTLAHGTIELTASDSQFELEGVTGGTVFCKTSYDDILVRALAGNDVSLRASNGGVSGTMAGSMGDYQISYKISDGDSNLPQNTAGTKKLYVQASYGDIDLSFDQNKAAAP